MAIATHRKFAVARLAALGFTFLLAALFATEATASIQTGDIVSIGNGPGSPGGIFYLKDSSGTKVTDTFCIQLEEYIGFNTSYKVADAYATSTLGKGSKPLTSFAAWLYDRYLNGIEGSGPVLSNFDFSNAYGQTNYGDASFQANELQLAIWQAMGYTPAEIGGVSGGWYATYSGKVDGWKDDFDEDVANNQWSETDTGDIYVLSLLKKDSSGQYTVNAQDQLIRQPSILPVPEAGSLLVWLALATTCVGLVWRKSTNA